MGIDSDIEAKLDICLGTPKISLYEMLGAYATYANQGFYNEPFAIKRIEDRQGNVLAVFRPNKKEAISSKTAYTMLGMMQEVVKRGTAIRLQSKYDFDNMIAAKTGETEDNSNAWFIGLVPQLAAGIWVGGDDKSIRFRTTRQGSGANMALPIWANFMNEVYADSSLQIRRDTVFMQPKTYDANILDCREEEEEKGGYNDEYD